MSAATVAAIGTVAAAGVGIAGAAGAFAPDAPGSPNYGQMTRDAQQAQLDLLPGKVAARQLYDPQLAALQRSINEQNIEQGMSLAERYAPRMNALTSAQRAQGIQDVNTLGPQALAALRAYDPESTGLLEQLTQQANEGLAAGGNLTAAERRLIQQNVRAGQAARGMGYGNADLYEEAINLYGGQDARLRQRQGFASGVINQRTQQYGDPYRILGIGDARNTSPQSYIGGQNENAMADAGQFQAGGLQSGLTGYYAQNQANIAGYNSQMQNIGALVGNARGLGQAGGQLYGAFGNLYNTGQFSTAPRGSLGGY